MNKLETALFVFIVNLKSQKMQVFKINMINWVNYTIKQNTEQSSYKKKEFLKMINYF